MLFQKHLVNLSHEFQPTLKYYSLMSLEETLQIRTLQQNRRSFSLSEEFSSEVKVARHHLLQMKTRNHLWVSN